MVNLITQILQQSEGRIFTATFVKKDGSLRTINCRLGVKKGLSGKGMSYNPVERGLLPVFDMQKKAYRMINMHTLKSVNIDGKKFVIG